MSSPKYKSLPFPVSNAVASYWRKEAGSIDNHCSTEKLPLEADVVIIGAGYVGASIAHHLMEQCVAADKRLPSILILEAREACSGATGRNGGHLKPDPLSRAASILDRYGKEVAEHVASFEQRQVAAVEELVRHEGIQCDFEQTRVTDVCLYQTGKEKIKADIAKLVDADISTSREISWHPECQAERISGVRGALSCHTYQAARAWPYKLVTHLLNKAVDAGVNLQTHTPVTSVDHSTSRVSKARWTVHTSRGSIETDDVVYATNGYTSALVPEMKEKIVPVRGIVAHIAGSGAPAMTDSYMMRFNEYEYDYLIPRPDGSIIVGGGKRDFFLNLNEWFDNYDDSALIDGAERYFDNYMQRNFHGWEDSGARTEQLWTGIMGYSNDGFPYVGPAEGRQGQYLCAGFSGHGMPQAFFSAKAIAEMLLGADATKIDLPLPYRITAERWHEPTEHVSLKLWQQVAERHPSKAML